MRFYSWKEIYNYAKMTDQGPGGGLTCVCHYMGMCHYFGYFFGVAPGFLGTFLDYSQILGYHFLAIP